MGRSHDADLDLKCFIRHGHPHFPGALDPRFDRVADVLDGLLFRVTLAETSRQAWHLGNPSAVFVVRIENNLSHGSGSDRDADSDPGRELPATCIATPPAISFYSFPLPVCAPVILPAAVPASPASTLLRPAGR